MSHSNNAIPPVRYGVSSDNSVVTVSERVEYQNITRQHNLYASIPPTAPPLPGDDPPTYEDAIIMKL